MNDVQTCLLSMYKDIAAVLDAHGFRYYALYGTAIGTVRHNGFIPWDNDIDLGVWAEDLPAVMDALESDLDKERYYVHDPTADTHPHVMLRTEDMEKDLGSEQTPFIDIFPIERYPEGRFRRAVSFAAVWGLHIWVTALNRVRPLAVHRMLSWIPAGHLRLAELMPEEGSRTTAIYTTAFAKELFPADWYGTPVRHRFEDTEIPLPEKWDLLLTAEFGDYMTPPPEDQRTGAKGFPLSVLKDYIMEKRGINCRRIRRRRFACRRRGCSFRARRR